MKQHLIFLFSLLSPLCLVAQYDLFVGSYTQNNKGSGISVYRFDSQSGRSELKNVTPAENPSFLALSPDGTHVYAVNELGDGMVSAYGYDKTSGKLTLLNQQSSAGAHPCHISIDPKGRHAVVSNYSGGNVSVFPLLPDGSLGPITQEIAFSGRGADPARQTRPHAHSAFFSPDGRYVFVQDLGTDQMHLFRYRPGRTQPLVSLTSVKTDPGAGPRHLAFSNTGHYLYLLEELTARLTVYACKRKGIVPIQQVDINESSFSGTNGAADVKISPDGKFVYATNRGTANTIAIFQVDPKSGQLTKVGNQSVLGEGPRNFNISPDGRFLLVANQQTDSIVVFSRDIHTGLLTATQQHIQTGTPVCVVF